MPQSDAGWRIDPPVSEPSDAQHIPAASAAADPPELPPGTRAGVPGISRGAEGAVFGGAAHGKFVEIGLAEKHRAGGSSF